MIALSAAQGSERHFDSEKNQQTQEMNFEDDDDDSENILDDSTFLQPQIAITAGKFPLQRNLGSKSFVTSF